MYMLIFRSVYPYIWKTPNIGPYLKLHLLRTNLCDERVAFSESNLFEGSTVPPWKLTWQWKSHHEWRCISYWKWGFSNVMLVFRGVYLVSLWYFTHIKTLVSRINLSLGQPVSALSVLAMPQTSDAKPSMSHLGAILQWYIIYIYISLSLRLRLAM